MRRFELFEPTTLAEASARLAEDPDAKALGGGTALLILIKHGVYLPGTLVNLRKIRGAGAIEAESGGGLRIGALASIRDVERHPLVRTGYPLLAEACHVVANVRIRNLATIGGNVAHADYQSDPPAALTALGASVEVIGPNGARAVPFAEFQLGTYETALESGELVSAIRLPAPEPGWHGTYLKFTTRSSEDRPAAGAAAMVRLEDGVVADARVVVGAVAPVPARSAAAEELGRGRRPGRELFAEIGAAAAAELEPIDDVRGSAEYKRRIAAVLVERALAAATKGAVA